MSSRWEVTQKINSLTNIRKVTAAMNLIASLRLRQLTARQGALEAFEAGLDEWQSAVSGALCERVAERRREARTLAVVFTSDRGLCGSHNHGVHRLLDELARETSAAGRSFEVVALGARGAAYVRRRGWTVLEQSTLKALPPEGVNHIADAVLERFSGGEVDTVELVYNRFVSTLRQIPTRQVILPLAELVPGGAEGASFEGSREQLAAEALPLLVRCRLAAALAQSQISEQAARMTAMDSASRNARDLMNRAIKQRNRVRQTGITNELMEVISGKEAMKR